LDFLLIKVFVGGDMEFLMSKFNFRGLKSIDWILLVLGFIFALLLIILWILPMADPSRSSLAKYSVQPVAAFAFLFLGIFTIKTQKAPQRNLGFFLVVFSAFAFFVSAVLIYKAVL
jgi:hypothetical protein